MKSFALVGANFETALFHREEHAPVCLDRLDREVEDKAKQLRQRAMACEFVARPYERRNLRGGDAL